MAHIPTCNLCLRRSVIKEVGPFDESFAKGQDFELNFRIAKAGYRLLYCPQVSVFHYRRESLSGLARQVFQWGRARFQLLRRHGLAGLSSYVSAWPIISVSVLALVGLFAILFEHVAGATLALVVGSGVYVLLLLAEALRLATRYKSAMLLVATPLILVIVHGAYFCGFLAGAPRATN